MSYAAPRYAGSFDPQSGELRLLFNPRTQQWTHHLILDESRLIGRTPEGHTTARVLFH
jgi:hypothetical protein